jgi:MoxR-like ATPase
VSAGGAGGPLGELARALRAALAEASRDLVEREVLVDLVALAAVAREHVLVIGPPGTAKSEAVRRVARAFEGQYFEYLLGRFTEPNEIFGAIDLGKLRQGVVETDVRGMLPEANLAFLDEVFQGSTAILNTLLGILNERLFTRGHTRMACPLRVCVGASNALPADESLAAFADRFLVRLFVDGVPDPRLEDLLESGWRAGAAGAPTRAVPLGTLDALSDRVGAVELAAARPALAQAVRQLRAAGVTLSDRRVVRAQRLVAAAAVLDGRLEATAADLWPLVYAVPTAAEQEQARDTLGPLLERSVNGTLAAAALDASQGPLARATRLARAADELLARAPAADLPAAERQAWRWQLEGVAREIDATFAPEALPEPLRDVRERLRARLDRAAEPSPTPSAAAAE